MFLLFHREYKPGNNVRNYEREKACDQHHKYKYQPEKRWIYGVKLTKTPANTGNHSACL